MTAPLGGFTRHQKPTLNSDTTALSLKFLARRYRELGVSLSVLGKICRILPVSGNSAENGSTWEIDLLFRLNEKKARLKRKTPTCQRRKDGQNIMK